LFIKRRKNWRIINKSISGGINMTHDYYLSLSNVQLDQNIDNLMLEVSKMKKKIMNKVNNNLDNQLINQFYPQKQDLESLPSNSTLIKISFTLKKSYTSKDEGEFNVIDNKRIFENPIVRDKFTGLPMVKPTTWKGHLRFAAENVELFENKKEIIKRLFGSEPEEKDNPLKGRLYFYPTFFKDEVKKDVITPLKRETRTPAKGPIPLEIVKQGTNGEFYLLYFPYPKGDNYQESQVYEDLEFLSKSLELMFYSYGFSAKKTSGFGVIERLKDNNVDVYLPEKKKIFSNLYNNLENNSQK